MSKLQLQVPLTFALAGRVLISWTRKVSGLTIITSGMPVVCCTQQTRPGWFITSDHWHSAGDILLLPPLDLTKGRRGRERWISFSVSQHIAKLMRNKRNVTTIFCNERELPFDINGEESLHFSGAAAHCGSEGLPLNVAEEKHLKHMGVID